MAETPSDLEFREKKYREFVEKLDHTAKVAAENTLWTKRLIRMLQANGFQNPDELQRAVRAGLTPVRRPAQTADVLAQLAQHAMDAFPPEDLRDMAEEFLDGFTRRRRRR